MREQAELEKKRRPSAKESDLPGQASAAGAETKLIKLQKVPADTKKAVRGAAVGQKRSSLRALSNGAT